MKRYILAGLLLLGAVSAKAEDITVVDNVITVKGYDADGVSLTTPTVKLDKAYVEAIKQINAEKKSLSRSEAIEEISKRTSSKFILQKMVELQAKLNAYKSLSQEQGIDVSEESTGLESEIAKLKSVYEASVK